MDFSNLIENHELFSNKNTKVNSKFKNEIPKNFWVDEFNCLGSEKFAFGGGDDGKNKSKIFASPILKTINLKILKIVYMVRIIRKNLILISPDLLVMNCIFKKN